LIDGFIMRDPGGYLDIVDILEDEQVIDKQLSGKVKEKVTFREKLIRYYDVIETEELRRFSIDIEPYRQFIHAVKSFLEKERAAGTIR
jgi:uncharacterized protein YutE (UPF0331/DUF86 family)